MVQQRGRGKKEEIFVEFICDVDILYINDKIFPYISKFLKGPLWTSPPPLTPPRMFCFPSDMTTRFIFWNIGLDGLSAFLYMIFTYFFKYFIKFYLLNAIQLDHLNLSHKIPLMVLAVPLSTLCFWHV